jgi:type II secretory pathway pseudopilin PulG
VTVEVLIVAGVVVVLAGAAALIVLRARRGRGGEGEATAAPWSRSERLSLLGTLLGAAVGVAGLVLSFASGSSSTPTPTTRGASPSAVAALIRQGPFSAALPAPLQPRGLSDVNISDASATNRIDAIQLKATDPTGAVEAFFGHIEVYGSEAEAASRAQARMDDIARLYGENQIQGTPMSYCAYLDPQPSWECGGSSGLIYAEATVTPNPNANRVFAAGSAAALLRYAEEKARVASE